MRGRFAAWLAAFSIVLGGVAFADVPPGTTFTYQGQLIKAGALVNDTADFQFSLWDDEFAGVQLGPTLTLIGVTVTDGLFTADLDFGQNIHKGRATWLKIMVRSPSGVGGYTTLDPRQALMPAPCAMALPGLWTQQNATSPNLIGGYDDNSVTAGVVGATIGGGGGAGNLNRVTANYGAVSGGLNNRVGNDGAANDGDYAFVGGGMNNIASGDDAIVGGGLSNLASGDWGTVGGGYGNQVTGDYAAIPGGVSNSAAGFYSLAAGRQAKALHDGSFVWGDSNAANFSSTAANQFLVRANGGVGINTNSPSSPLTVAGMIQSTAGGFKFPDLTVQTSAGLAGSGTAGYLPKYAGASTLGNSILYETGGMIGVNDPTPSAAIDVTTPFNDTLWLRGPGGFTTNGRIRFQDSAGNVFIQNDMDGGMLINVNGSLGGRLALTGGDVGIGTTTPAYPLDVNGAVRFSSPGIGTSANLIIDDSNGSNDRPGIQFTNNNIHFIGGDDLSDEWFGFYSEYSSIRTYDAAVHVHGKTAGSWGTYLSLTHDGTDGRIGTDVGDLVLEPFGSVGIRTAAPAADLHVVGSTATLGSLIVAPDEPLNGGDSKLLLAEDAAGIYHMRWDYDGGANRLNLYGSAVGTDYGPHLTINRDNGYVGVNTPTPSGPLHVTDATPGNTSVILPNDSISAIEIMDEPGVANDHNASIAIGTSLTTLASRSITVPAAGYVLALADGDLQISHTNGTDSTYIYGVSDSATSLPSDQDMMTRLAGALTTGTYNFAGSSHGLFSVAAAGSYSFYYLAYEFSGGSATMYDIQLTLLYVPTAYGTVESNLPPPNGGGGPETQGREPAAPGITPEEIEAEQQLEVENHRLRVLAELEAAEAQIAELRAKLEALEKPDK
ncbi:MAG: hypothetical protein CHACPFDD_02820 [Phycisphaerae bacterium]|nr:hypothetical protein [Phycisphaerae bacterium]